MASPKRRTYRYMIEFVEYGYQRMLLAVDAHNRRAAVRKVQRYDPMFDPVSGVEVVEATFEVTGSELTNVERVPRRRPRTTLP